MRNARTDQALDPRPKTGTKAPSVAFDTHVHLFGPTGKYPFASDSRYEAREALPETLIALQDVLELNMAAIVSARASELMMIDDVLLRWCGGILEMSHPLRAGRRARCATAKNCSTSH